MKRKALFTSTILLLVAIICLATASYAWFTTNNTVTATGISVDINAGDGYLLISKDKTTASEIQAQGLTTVDMAINESALSPAAHETFANSSAVALATNWYTAKASDASASAMDSGTKAPLSGFANYVAVGDVYITNTEDTADLSNLKANVTFDADPDTAVRVIIATANDYEEFSASGNGTKTLASTVTSTEAIKATIYVYYDGNADNIFTKGAAAIKSGSISVNFVAE